MVKNECWHQSDLGLTSSCFSFFFYFVLLFVKRKSVLVFLDCVSGIKLVLVKLNKIISWHIRSTQ